jgi:Protein of unknown function (DUF5818)
MMQFSKVQMQLSIVLIAAATGLVPAVAQSQGQGQSSGSAGQEMSAQTSTTAPERQDETMPAPSQPQASADQSSAMQEQGFAGKVTKSKDGMVLKDPTNHTTYKLDNAEKARQFLGKNVTVTGILDHATKTIHVSNIEPAPTF